MEIGTNIKVLRTAKKIRQKDLAITLGITTNYLSMVENNSKKPSLSLIERLAKVWGLPLALFFAEPPLATS